MHTRDKKRTRRNLVVFTVLVLGLGALSAIVSIAVVLLFGAQNLSRKHERDVLELEEA